MANEKDITIYRPDGLPAVIIPREHQSAPKQHWADKVVQQAAEEIESGNYVVDVDPDEMFNYGPTMALAQHPRVLEALERLEKEKVEVKGQEAIEKEQMIWEINQRRSQQDMWDGQGRWIGKDNEEMRVVNILSPFAFIRKLYASGIKESRVQLNPYAVKKRAALVSWQLNLATGKREQQQVGTVQYPCGPEWMVMRFDEYGVPTEAKYLGWRTALLSMITLGVITEKEAHKAFPLGSGPAADWYREQLAMHRAKCAPPGVWVN